MVLLRCGIAASGGAGFFCAALFGCASSRRVVKAESSSDGKAEEQSSVEPVKCVVVGGGYAGSRIAYQLDSVFHVTLVDTKNYFEASDELTSVLTAPTDQAFTDRLDDIHGLHRYYLRRARVITAKVVDADKVSVHLADGRRLPYDILILAVGETRPYPFAPEPVTCDVREAQLTEFRKFLLDPKRKKIAIVGGGPRGASLASCLAVGFRDKEVHLFHSTGTYAHQLPHEARERMDAVISSNPLIHQHRNSVVTGIRMSVDGRPVERREDSDGATDEKTKQQPPSSGVWWPFRRSRNTSQKNNAPADGPTLSADSTVKYTLEVSHREDTKVEIPSVFFQVWSGERPKHIMKRGAETGTETFEGFDYVFNCTGSMGNARQFASSKFLGPHVDSEGHFITSRYMQLLGNARVFALGRSTNFTWMRSMGNSDFQSRTLFRNLLSVGNMNEVKTGNLVPTMMPLTNSSMTFPRIIVPVDEFQAVGSIAWSGSIVGIRAMKDLEQDRKYYLRDFKKPIFFKQQDDKKIRDAVDAFFKQNVTDVSDFDLGDA